MSALKPVARLLQRSLRRLLLRRALVWLAWAAISIAVGGTLVQPFESARVFRLGLFMLALSALPAFLFWPPSRSFLLERLRRLDEETVFEAYLEAGPGPVRELLRRLAVERAALAQAPRESLTGGLRKLLAAAAACVVLAEAGSFFFRGRLLGLGLDPPAEAGGGARLEEQGFSEFATEDPAARQARRGRLLSQEERAERAGTRSTRGQSEASRAGASLVGGGEGQGAAAPDRAGLKEALAKRRQGDFEGAGAPTGFEGAGAPTGPGPAPSPGEGRRAASGEPPGPGGASRADTGAPEREGLPATMGGSNQGYGHTPDTKVPSPLLDYRSRFEARYAERTGRHVAASGQLGAGDLRDFQRRYFASFELRTDVGGAEDPYLTLLKQRWQDVKGGLR